MIATYAPMFLMIAVASLLAGLFFTGATFLGGKVNKIYRIYKKAL